MKRLICMTLILTIICSLYPLQAQAASNNNDPHFGYIRVLHSGVSVPEPYRAARDHEDNVYIHAGDFSRIIGATVTSTENEYQYRFGVWSLTISCNDFQAILLYHPTADGRAYNFYGSFTLPQGLYNDEESCWYLPMEHLLYLSLCEWFCIENFVAVYQPETLLDLVPDIPKLTANNPDYADLMMNSKGSNIGNSILYAIGSTIDELDMTFIKDSILISFGVQDNFRFEDDILKSALLLLSDDSSMDTDTSQTPPLEIDTFSEISKFVSAVSYTTELAGSDASMSALEKLIALNGTPLTSSQIQSITDHMSTTSTTLNVISVATDYVMGVASTLWTKNFISENFQDRLIYLQECTSGSDQAFAQQLGRVAKNAETEYYTAYGAITSNITFDQLYGLVSAYSSLIPGGILINAPQFALATIDLVVEASKDDPILAPLYKTAEQAHTCLYLLKITSYMEGVGQDLIGSLTLNPQKLDQSYLEDLRYSYQISQCAAIHTQHLLADMNKVNDATLAGGTELLLRLSTSSKYDQLLMLSTSYTDLYSSNAGCIREEIPGEYVYGGKGVFLRPVEQKQEVPNGYVGIYTNQDLLDIQNDMSGSYILMEDLTFDSWTPLGNFGDYTNAFCGVLDGNGHSITINLSQVAPFNSSTYIGLFLRLASAVVQNLHIKGDWHINGEDRYKNKVFDESIVVGGISAFAENGSTIFNCVNEVNISSDVQYSIFGLDEQIAGIVADTGYLEPVNISYCRNLGTLSGQESVAGIVSDADCGSVFACQNDGTIDSSYHAAGIVNNTYNLVSSCANFGEVHGLGGAAGIVNNVRNNTKIEDCINLGHISIENRTNPTAAGGIATFSYGGIIQNCINLGETTGCPGSICGWLQKEGNLENCYWLNEDEWSYSNSSFTAYDGKDPLLGKLSEDQLTDKKSFPGFDFLTFWTLSENMPYPFPSALLDNSTPSA